MALVKKIEYTSHLRREADVSPKSVLELLSDVKDNLKELDSTLEYLSEIELFEMVRRGCVEIKGKGKGVTSIDLSSARKFVDRYMQDSEGGCQSCTHTKGEGSNDSKLNLYCKVNESGPERGNYQGGLSPKVRKHFYEPCEKWDPKISTNIRKIICQE